VDLLKVEQDPNKIQTQSEINLNLSQKIDFPLSNSQQDSNLEINQEDFDNYVNKAILKLVDYFNKNEKQLEQELRSVIFLQEINQQEIEVIMIHEFIRELERLGINFDQITHNCIFEKWKISEEFQFISLIKMKDDLIKFGLKEKAIQSKEISENDLLIKLGSFLKEKKLKLVHFLSQLLDNSSEFCKIEDFILLLKENQIIQNDLISISSLKSICNDSFTHIVTGKLKVQLEKTFKKLKKELKDLKDIGKVPSSKSNSKFNAEDYDKVKKIIKLGEYFK